MPGNCLLILHDWSNALLLREKEIDKERKIIHEEWRTRRDASQRIIETIAPAIFKDSKYAHRMPIGSITGNMAYSEEDIILLNALKQLFQLKFTDKIREEQGGTYGVQVHS